MDDIIILKRNNYFRKFDKDLNSKA